MLKSLNARTYSVSELTIIIRDMLENEFPNIAVEGEISNFRPSSTGHYYFSLKDKDAILSVVMFKNRHGALQFEPADGMLVQAFGSVSVYPKRGNYQLICEQLVKAGKGDILAMLEERKKLLASEGLFDISRKKPLPLFPQKVVVITSPTGAAIKDVLKVLKRRNAGINLVILPCPVQGEEAAFQISEKVQMANRFNMGDVIIMGRGGGSLEDLLPFYDELVVRAIADSTIPVISAVGHEIDFTLSDLAADVRAPTPSAAAELVSASREELLRRILEIKGQIAAIIKQRIENLKTYLLQFKTENFERNIRLLIQNQLLRLDDAKETLLNGINDMLLNKQHKLELLSQIILSHSPLAILKKGYAVVTDDRTQKVLCSVRAIKTQDKVRIRLYEGKMRAEIEEILDHEKF